MRRQFLVHTLLLAVLAGCDRNDRGRADVRGTVTYDGKPVADGHIRFVPTTETGGPVSGAKVVAGQYNATGRAGVPVGTYRVEITWERSMPNPVASDLNKVASEQLIPDRYNSHSELTLVVPPGKKSIQQDYNLMP